jgi:hypothetical protein
MDAPRRSIVREHSFERGLRALIENAEAADAFVESAEFLLAANPREGVEAMPGVWMFTMAPIDGRGITLYYSFNDETVWFLAIGPTEGDDEHDDDE